MDHTFNGRTEYLCIRVQEQDIPARGVGEPEVVGPGKSKILIALNEVYRREFVSDHLAAAIARRIVNYDYLKLDVRRVRIDTRQTLPQQGSGVPVDNDDGKVEAGGNGRHQFY